MRILAHRDTSPIIARRIGLIFLLSLLLFLSGCVNQSVATLSPGTNLSKAKSFYVVSLPADKRSIDKLICDQLIKMGYAARSGPELPAAQYNADVVVTYGDKWAWDMTMYMLELSITFRDPASGYPLATGKAMHGSLSRRSPQAMVEETLGLIFNKIKQET